MKSLCVPAMLAALSAPGPLVMAAHAESGNDTMFDLAAAPTDLQITGFASTRGPARSSAFSYTFHIKNSGPVGVAGATFTDSLPVALPLNGVSTSTAGVTCSTAGRTVTCDLGGLANGGQAVIVVSTTAPPVAGTFTNTASVTSSSPDPRPANDSVAVTVQVR